jgi:dihydroflavonol-4-reductase
MTNYNFENSTILVTGASGFIGAYLCPALQKAGATVRACGLIANETEAQRVKELRSHGLEYRETDLLDPEQVRAAADGATAVIHMAAAQHESSQPEAYFHRINVDGTRILLDACVATGVSRFIYGSSIGVFGTGGLSPLNESSPLAPNNAYGRSKVAAESVVNDYANRLDITIARFSETYGDYDYKLLKLFRAAEKGFMIQIGDGSNLHQPIHVDDLSNCIMSALDREETFGATVLLAGKERVSTQTMLTAVNDAMGSKARTIRIPMPPMMLAAIMCEKIFGAIGVDAPLHRRRLEFFTKNLIFDMDSSFQKVGFEPAISFADGCRQTADWYRSRGLVGQS